MSNIEKLKQTPEKRTSPRLNAIKAAGLKRQQLLRERGQKPCSGNIDIVHDPYGAAVKSREMVRKSTGLVFSPFMAEHFNPWDSEHIEKPARLLDSYARCEEMDLINRCTRLPTRLASDEELMLVHSEKHIRDLKDIVALADNPDTLEEAKLRIITNYHGIYMNGKTLDCARMAAAGVIDLVASVVRGEVSNGLALVRPPGHHAMETEFNGFCICNNVAMAAKNAIDNLGVGRILIVDFDVHHGQATQRIFYDDPKVLYVSIHRYEEGLFWPNLRESNFDAIGTKQGQGFNVNIPLNEIGCDDTDYEAIFHQIILPVAYEFSPELVLVSAGFDAAFGCPEGCMRVMPALYGHFINSLQALAGGKVAVVLEGGYFVPTVAEGVAMCLRSLLGDFCLSVGPLADPKPSVVATILNVITAHKPFWRFLRLQDEYLASSEQSETAQRHQPVVVFKGDEAEKDIQYLTKVYDPKFHYSQHSETVFSSLLAEFREIQLSYERKISRHKSRTYRLGVVYDELMMRHHNVNEPGHPERPTRIERIFQCLKEFGIMERQDVVHLPSRRATEEEILLVHDSNHLDFLKSIPAKSQKDLDTMAEALDSIYLTQDSFDCALISSGGLLTLVDAVCQNECHKGLAVVRPPGHHAECDEASGFCLLNNVAMAAKYALETHDLRRILILDWDVHHGNGIQNTFYDDPRVLYVSIHRYDNGTFFPSKPDANYDFVGTAKGEGFNVNVPWNGSGMGDAEYLLAFFSVVLPIAYEFDPELVLVASGMDAAVGDPLGKCKVSPEMYGHMCHHLQALADGKIIVALEGGYNLNSISYSMTLCAKALVGDPLPPLTFKEPKASAKTSIKNVIQQHSKYWSCLKYGVSLPDKLTEAEIPVLAEATTVDSSSAASERFLSRDSSYIPFQYGVPSSTYGSYTLTASRHFHTDDLMSPAKDLRIAALSEAVPIKSNPISVSDAASWPPAVTELPGVTSNIWLSDYVPNEFGACSPASYVYTFSEAREMAAPIISSDSAKKEDEAKTE